MQAETENHNRVDFETARLTTLPSYILEEVITVTKVVGSVRMIYRGSVGSLIAIGVLAPPKFDA